MFEIGNSLREARLRQQLDFPELEQTTKIRGKYLRALEEEKFDALPASTYIKGFLRTYADSLGLEGQLYVDEYNSRYVTGEDEVPVRPRRSTASPPLTRMATRGVVITILAIGLVFALVIVAWKFGSNSSPRYSGVNTSEPSAPRPRHSHARTPHKLVRVAPAVASILLTANGDCWLEVRVARSNGKLLYKGTLQAGQKLPFSAPRLWVSAGAPTHLAVQVNGRPARVPGGVLPSQLVVTPAGVTRAPRAA